MEEERSSSVQNWGLRYRLAGTSVPEGKEREKEEREGKQPVERIFHPLPPIDVYR